MSTKRSIDLLEKAVNSYLLLDPEIVEKFSALKDSVIAIELLGLNRTFYLLPRQEKSGETVVGILDHFEGNADTTLSGTPLALLKMGLASDATSLMLKGEVEIRGDIRLGKAFKKIMADMDIDWEDHLASLIGDIPAHQALRLSHKLSSWTRQTRDSLMADLSEYLQEESRDVVSGVELEMFYESVDLLRDDMNRLRARLEALKGK